MTGDAAPLTARQRAILTAIRDFARFNNCTAIVFKKSNNKPYLTAIRNNL